MSAESSHPSKPAFSPVAGLALGILAVSTASLFIRFAQQDAPSLVIAAARLSLAVLVLLPFALTRARGELRQLTRRQLLLLGLAGLFLGLHFATWITSLEYTSVASSVVLVTTAPLWVALLSPIFLRERLPASTALGLGVALVGGVVVGLSQGCQLQGGFSCPGMADFFQGRSFTGNLLALAGAFLSGSYLMVGRRVRATLSLTAYTFVVYGVAALTLLLLVAFSGQSLLGYSPRTYLWFALLALIPQLLGHSSFNWALRYLRAAYVSVALLGEPIGTILLAFLFLKESPTPLELTGGVLILAGIFLATRAERT